MAEILLTVEEAASRLRMHPVSVRRQLQEGRLRGVKRGKWRIPESALTESTPPMPKTLKSPLTRALALVRERDAQAGDVPTRNNGSAASDVRAVREAQTR